MTTRILVADDDAAIRQLVRRVLEEHSGWEVCGEAVDGQDAVIKAALLAPDVVVLDLAMPGKNGLQAAREIATIAPMASMVLLTVQDTSAELKKEAQRAGFGAVISKETGTEVVQGIEHLLRARPAS